MDDTFPLIIDKKNSQLSLKNNQLTVKTLYDTHHIPLHMINPLIIATNCQITTHLLQKLAEKDIITLILPSRGAGQAAWITPGLSSSWKWRKKQYLQQYNPHLAWYWVEEKLKAQQHSLKLLECPLGPLEKITPPHSLKLDTIMGMEGAASRYYFQQLSTIIPPQWNFKGRNRQPPKDPFNALLSLSYSLFTTESLRATQYHGFDPWIGFLHQPYPGRPALALDLIEPLRPLIDLWCLNLIDNLDPQNHFNQQDNQALLNKNGRSIYFATWAQDRQNWYNEKSVQQILNQKLNQFKEVLANYTEAGYEEQL